MALSTNTPPVTVPESNTTPPCPFGTTPDANGNCIQENLPANTGNLVDLIVPESGTCQEQGKIECTNGSCADTLEECVTKYDIGYEPEGKFITDDPNTPEHNEALYDVYLAINNVDGPEGWTGLSFEDWVEKYGHTFPQWEGSQYEAQSELLESQLGLLKPALELKMKSFDLQKEQNRWQTTTKLEDQNFAAEAMWRSTGGLGSSPLEKKVETAYDRVLEGFDYEQERIDMERENSLIDFADKEMKYAFDLSKVVSDFQDNMWDLITANKALQEGVGDQTCEEQGLVACANGSCATTIEECSTASDGVGTGDQPPGNQGIADEAYCTEICTPYAGMEAGGMTCYDSCLGTPILGGGQFTPQDFQWIDRQEEEAACDGTFEWDSSTGEYVCTPGSNTPSCSYPYTWNGSCCSHMTTNECA